MAAQKGGKKTAVRRQPITPTMFAPTVKRPTPITVPTVMVTDSLKPKQRFKLLLSDFE